MEGASLRPGFIAAMLPGEHIVARSLRPVPKPIEAVPLAAVNRRIDHRLLLGRDHEVFEFVGGSLPGGKGIGVLNADGLLVGGIVLHDWHPEEGVVRLTARAIAKTWLTCRLLRTVGACIFDHLGCQACLMISDEGSAAASIARRLGCDEHRVPRLLGRDRAGIIFMLTEEAWRVGRFASSRGARMNGKG